MGDELFMSEIANYNCVDCGTDKIPLTTSMSDNKWRCTRHHNINFNNHIKKEEIKNVQQ